MKDPWARGIVEILEPIEAFPTCSAIRRPLPGGGIRIRFVGVPASILTVPLPSRIIRNNDRGGQILFGGNKILGQRHGKKQNQEAKQKKIRL